MSNYSPFKKVEINRRVLNQNGLNPWDAYTNAARKQMFSGSHIAQAVVINHPGQKLFLTGMEKRYGEQVYDVAMPVDATIRSVIPRYRARDDLESVIASDNLNPETLVIYVEHQTGKIGVLVLPCHFSGHTYFGYNYVRTEHLSKIRAGERIRAGTVFLTSPNVRAHGEYRYGRSFNTAIFSHPAGIEDGFLINRDVINDLGTTIFKFRETGWGENEFPTNMYGDPNNDDDYRIFPDIGQYVRPDDILMNFRRDDPYTGWIDQSAKKLRTRNASRDRPLYSGGGGLIPGRVVDIEVFHDEYRVSELPEQMDRQVLKYYRENRRFYQDIQEELQRIDREFGKDQARDLISEHLQMLGTRALGITENRPASAQDRRKLTHQDNPIDIWRVRFTIEHKVIPNLGFKMSNAAANKGVITRICDPEEMPRDADGNVADIALAPHAPINRETVSLPLELYFGSVVLKVTATLRQMTGIAEGDPNPGPKLKNLLRDDPERFNEAWEYLKHYLYLVAPNTHAKVLDSEEWLANGGSRLEYLTDELSKKYITTYTPPENDRNFSWAINQIEADPRYRPCYGPVTYRDMIGKTVQTFEPVRIGPVYYILLEKITDDGSAVASSKTQLHGYLAQTTHRDKHTSPLKMNPTRVVSETDFRNIMAYAGTLAGTELSDRQNSVLTRREAQRVILSSDKPTNIDTLIDRTRFRYDGSSPLQVLRNVMFAGGYKLVYHKYHDPEQDHAQDPR